DGLVDDAGEPPREVDLLLGANAAPAAGGGSGGASGDREAMRPERGEERAEPGPVRARGELLERPGEELLVRPRPRVQLAEVPAVERDRHGGHLGGRRRSGRLRGWRGGAVPAGGVIPARASRPGGLPR